MKKWMNGLLAFVLAFALTACGAAGTVGDGGYAGQTAETTQTEQGAETQEADEAGADTEDAEIAESEDDGEQSSDEKTQQNVTADAGTSDVALDEELSAGGIDNNSDTAEVDAEALDEDGTYTTKEDVAAYIHAYGHLPNNFITKKEAEKLGWSGGSLEPYAPGKCIGGSRFGNYEGVLPEKKGRIYTECDIDTLGASKRGAKRIVFSNDGLIYYTGDHYETFELLYGEE